MMIRQIDLFFVSNVNVHSCVQRSCVKPYGSLLLSTMYVFFLSLIGLIILLASCYFVCSVICSFILSYHIIDFWKRHVQEKNHFIIMFISLVPFYKFSAIYC